MKSTYHFYQKRFIFNFIKHKNWTLNIIEAIKTENRRAISTIYNAQKLSFLKWALKRFSCSDEVILDSFQDAIVTLYSNIKSGRLENISSEPEAYLFGIAKNILFNQVKRNSKVNLKEEIDDSVMKNLDYNIYERIDSEYRKNIIQQAFARLADSCRDLLTLFYLEQNSLESIQLKLNYSSIGTVKTRKVQCLIKMRMIVKDLQVHE